MESSRRAGREKSLVRQRIIAGFDPSRPSQRALRERFAAVTPPFFINSQEEVPSIEEMEAAQGKSKPKAAASGEVLKGDAGSAGIARGRARIVLDPSDARGLNPGDILVAPLTDPAWTPLFLPASAVVVNVGALMSHAVIVSRELGIPCVVAVQNAADRIVDGTMLEVDGTAGTVKMLEMQGAGSRSTSAQPLLSESSHQPEDDQ